MSTDDRVQALRRTLPAIVDQDDAEVLLAGLAELESAAAGALCLYIQGIPGALDRLLGTDTAGLAGLISMPIVAAYGAATEAIAAAVGDDPDRGFAVLATLQERAAEYAAVHQQIVRDTPGRNPG